MASSRSKTQEVSDEIEEAEQEVEAAPPAPGLATPLQFIEGPSQTELKMYSKLSAPFDETFHDTRGGIDLEYISGEQAVTRLNEVLGVRGWSFETVGEPKYNAEADEIVVKGRLTLNVPWGQQIVREQFGSKKVRRPRGGGNPLDSGFDHKGATTDALKKCASLVGVGLYLSKRDPNVQRPVYTPSSPSSRPATTSPDGTVTGQIAVINRYGTGLKLEGHEDWMNLGSNQNGIDLGNFQKGQRVAIEANGRYINNIRALTNEPAPVRAESEDPTKLPF